MIEQDKKVLKASLQKGTLSIQYKLVFLYAHNLGSLSINSALIATLSVLGLIETRYPTGHIEDWFWGFIYYAFICVSIVTALYAHTLAAIEVTWGPLMALGGSESEDVLAASSHMRMTQLESTMWEGVAGVTLIIAVWVWILAHSGYVVGIPVTTIVFGFLYAMTVEGKRAYNEYDLREDKRDYIEVNMEDDEFTDTKSTVSAGGGSPLNPKDRLRERKEVMLERIRNVTGEGRLWTKSLHLQDRKRQSDCFHKAFLTVEDGRLNMYSSEKVFVENGRPCNTVPIDLKDYVLETNPKIIAQHTQLHISASSSLRSALVGSQEISFHEALVADFDVQFAAKKLKFSLIPKNSSELQARDILHFMAEDEAMYKTWTGIFRVAIATYRELDSIKAQELQIKGTTVVMQAVAAANHRTK